MNEHTRSVRLSGRQTAYLREQRFLPDALEQTIEKSEPLDDGGCLLLLAPAIAEEFRSTFTDYLAKVGFDTNYEPTSEGKMLEELIDRFT